MLLNLEKGGSQDLTSPHFKKYVVHSSS